MTYRSLYLASSSFSNVITARSVLVLPCLLAASLTGCAAFSSEKPAESAVADESAAPAPMATEDEVPNVDNCHTDTQVCALNEPLQPGLGCFCAGEDGANQPGSA